MKSRTGSARRILEILKKVSGVENWRPNEKGWLSLARGGPGLVSQEMGGGRCKSQNRKNVYLSPYVEELLNSKVIKSFVPELRIRKCFSYFQIPKFYVIYIWTLYVNFTHCRIWLWYTCFDQIPEITVQRSAAVLLLTPISQTIQVT